MMTFVPVITLMVRWVRDGWVSHSWLSSSPASVSTRSSPRVTRVVERVACAEDDTWPHSTRVQIRIIQPG